MPVGTVSKQVKKFISRMIATSRTHLRLLLQPTCPFAPLSCFWRFFCCEILRSEPPPETSSQNILARVNTVKIAPTSTDTASKTPKKTLLHVTDDLIESDHRRIYSGPRKPHPRAGPSLRHQALNDALLPMARTKTLRRWELHVLDAKYGGT